MRTGKKELQREKIDTQVKREQSSARPGLGIPEGITDAVDTHESEWRQSDIAVVKQRSHARLKTNRALATSEAYGRKK